MTRWRLWLYDCLAPRVPAALAGWRSGDLLARAIDDVDALQDLYLRTLLPVAIAVGAAVIGTVAVGVILPWAALALGLPLLVALTVPAFVTWHRGADEEVAAIAGTVSSHVVDALAGAPELLAFGADVRLLHDVEELGTRADALEARHARLGTATALLIQVCLAVAVTTVLACGVAAVHAHHLGQVMVAVLPLAALATFETVPGVPVAVARSLEVRAAARRLFALEAVPVPVEDPPAPEAVPAGVPEVVFAGAALRYDPGLPRALDGVDLRLPAGGRVAVTGSSGAGKSSLVTALLRFWPLEDGLLSLGGVEVSRLDQADVRAACALADQRAQLFAGTVRSNLTLGRPDASDEDLTAALRAACSTCGWRRCLRDSTPRSARTVWRCPAASADVSPWPVPSCRPATSWCSTSPPAVSTRPSPMRSSPACWAPPGGGASSSSPIAPRKQPVATSRSPWKPDGRSPHRLPDRTTCPHGDWTAGGSLSFRCDGHARNVRLHPHAASRIEAPGRAAHQDPARSGSGASSHRSASPQRPLDSPH